MSAAFTYVTMESKMDFLCCGGLFGFILHKFVAGFAVELTPILKDAGVQLVVLNHG